MPLRTGRASRKKLLWAFAVRATSEAAVRRSLGRPWKSSIPHSPASSADARWFSVQKITPSAPAADTRPEPLRDLPRRGAEYLPSAGRDIAALHFGDPERVFPGSGADDVGHERDSQRVLRPGEITEVPAQVHRHAQRGQKPFVGGEIVVGEVVQKLVGIDVFVVLQGRADRPAMRSIPGTTS